MSEGFLTSPNREKLESGTSDLLWAMCLMYIEKSNESGGTLYCYQQYKELDVTLDPPSYTDSGYLVVAQEVRSNEQYMHTLFTQYLSRLNRSKDGVEDVHDIVMIPKSNSSSKKTPIPIRRIFHIASKKLFHNVKPLGSPKNIIEWTHQWSVRGCWVRLEEGKIGKDRDGKYTIYGKTWQKAHIKDNKELPLIQKVRTV